MRASATRNSAGSSSTVVGSSNSGGLNLAAKAANAHRALDGNAYLTRGYLLLSGSLSWATPGGASGVDGYVGGSLSSVDVGTGWRTSIGGGLVGGGSARASVSLDRRVTDLGDYSGEDPALQGLRKLEFRRCTGGGGGLGASGVASFLGLGGSLTVERSNEVVYRTHREPGEAHPLVFERKGVVGFLRDKARAAGVAEEPVAIPPLDEPESIAVGDELVVSTSGSLIAGLALGTFGISVGAQVSLQGDFALAVRRTSEHHLELVVTPTQVRGAELIGRAPALLQVGLTRTAAQSLRQAFVFDLREPTARQAYLRALRGELPGDPRPVPEAATELIEHLQAEVLPAGVGRLGVGHEEATCVKAGGGLDWGPLHPEGGIFNLSGYKLHSRTHRVVSEGTAALAIDSRGVDTRKALLLSGTEKCGVSASIKQLTSLEGGASTTRLIGVSLVARFSDDKVRGLELNEDVIERINGTFGTQLTPLVRKRKNESWEVRLERLFSPVELNALVAAPPAEVEQAAEAAGLEPQGLTEFLERLRLTADDSARAQKVQDFVADRGLSAFGALHRLAGRSGEALQIEATNGAYQSAVTTAEQLAFEHRQPFRFAQGPDALVRRFAGAEKVFQAIEAAQADLDDDPFVDVGERAQVSKSLSAARGKVSEVISVGQLAPGERLELCRALEAGWTTALEERVRVHLMQAGVA